nr:RsiV family protein [Heyndrickxia oleronia]
MDKKLEELKNEYKNTPIPKELDEIVNKALQHKNKKPFRYHWLVGAAAAAIIFTASVNISPTFAKNLSKVPVLGSVVEVITFKEINVDDENYNAHLKVPKVNNLNNKNLESSLNKKYISENQKLYNDFTKEVENLKKKGGGHLGVDSGYEIKTNDDKILSIERYVVNTQASSSTTVHYDTVDKEKQILLTLPILFKDHDYIKVISENIKDQMRDQMKKDPNKIYWVDNAGIEDLDLTEAFNQISANQSFYINKDHKLVITFNEYEVAPGYMGTVEFIIPTNVISNELVGHDYIK